MDRHVDGVHGRLALLMVHIGVVHIDEAIVKAGNYHPMREFFTIDHPRRDQHQGYTAFVEDLFHFLHVQGADGNRYPEGA